MTAVLRAAAGVDAAVRGLSGAPGCWAVAGGSFLRVFGTLTHAVRIAPLGRIFVVALAVLLAVSDIPARTIRF